MKGVLLVLASAIMLSGCIDESAPTKSSPEYGELRKKLFTECMNLAAKNPRSADDDVSDIVEECTDTSYYLANSY